MKKGIIITLFLLVETLFIYNFFFEKRMVTTITNDLAENPIGEIITTDRILQKVVLEDDIDYIALKFATYDRKNDAHVNITFYNENNDFLRDFYLSNEDIKDNEFYLFELNKGMLRELTIEITSIDGIEGNSFTVWQSNSDIYKGDLYINDEIAQGDLNIKTLKSRYKYEELYNSLKKLPVTPNKIIFIVIGMFIAFNLLVISIFRKVGSGKIEN